MGARVTARCCAAARSSGWPISASAGTVRGGRAAARRARRLDIEAARPLAAIHLAKGETSLARDVLERALDQIDPPSTAAAPLLALLVDVHLAADRPDDAGDAADAARDVCAASPRATI